MLSILSIMVLTKLLPFLLSCALFDAMRIGLVYQLKVVGSTH